MSELKVSPEQAQNIGRKLKSNSVKINNELASICKKYEKINGYWKSQAWDEYYQLYNQQKKIIEEMQKELSECPKLIEKCMEQYNKAERENINMAVEVLQGNIIK